LSPRQGRRTATCPTASDSASLALELPCVPRLQILPPCSGGFRCCHVSRGSESCLPAHKGSGVATCPTAPDPASLLERASVLPHVPRLWILPPYLGGFRRCHVSHSTEPRLPAREGSDAATCPAAPCGPRASSIKKSLAVLPVQLGTHVPNARVQVFKPPDIRTIMDLQDVRPDNTVNACKACR
jgi:hypothetical protein